MCLCTEEAQAGDAQNIILGGNALTHNEPLDLGLPEADILGDEEFTLNAKDCPTILGSKGTGRPAYSRRLYANPQPDDEYTLDDDSLELYDAQHALHHNIDLALARLSDPGEVHTAKEQLLGCMHDLKQQWQDWMGRAHGLDYCLKAANIPTCLELFLPDPLPTMLTCVALNYAEHLGARITTYANNDDGPAAFPIPPPPAPVAGMAPPPQPFAPPVTHEQPRLTGEEQLYQTCLCFYCATTKHLLFECPTPHE
ncbi:hypothetical protein EDB85DRAFT_1886731 [Lactarius pseudohatsudake]|nr:hypothetical protein EDB85DRAFT_1886731 [Lactarius pseudohatsudake]